MAELLRERVQRAVVWTITGCLTIGIGAVRGATLALSDTDVRLN